MNLVLFDHQEDVILLSADDPRYAHIQTVLGMGVGDSLYVGAVNGPRGKARIVESTNKGLSLEMVWEKTCPKLQPLELWVGLPRPQTAKHILREGASLGVSKMRFFQSDKGEPSYAQASLWRNQAYIEHLKAGAAQAFHTALPQLEVLDSLDALIHQLDKKHKALLALDVYEASISMQDTGPLAPAILAIGNERGWSQRERGILKQAHFIFAHMGDRVLRTETACVAATAIVLSKMKQLNAGWGQNTG